MNDRKWIWWYVFLFLILVMIVTGLIKLSNVAEALLIVGLAPGWW